MHERAEPPAYLGRQSGRRRRRCGLVTHPPLAHSSIRDHNALCSLSGYHRGERGAHGRGTEEESGRGGAIHGAALGRHEVLLRRQRGRRPSTLSPSSSGPTSLLKSHSVLYVVRLTLFLSLSFSLLPSPLILFLPA